MTEEIKQIIEGSPESEHKKKVNLVKLIPPIFFGISILILIIIWITFPTFAKIWIFVIGGVIGLVCLTIFITPNIIEYWKNKGKEETENNTPKPITYGEADLESERIMSNKKYATYIGNVFDEGVEEHGENIKQKIFCKTFKGYNNNMLYFFGINMHYWETNKRVVSLGEYSGEKSYDEIYKKHKLVIDQCKKRLASDTEKPMNTKTTRRSNQSLGYEEEVIEKTKPESKENKKQQEDVV